MGVDTREAIYQGLEIGAVTASEAKTTADKTAESQDNLNQRVDDQIAANTIKDEEIDFRHSDMLKKTFETMRKRGDFYDNEFAGRGVNVKWFGAVGDGVTDDTNAIEAAIDFCTNLAGEDDGEHSYYHGTVYFPKGKYYMAGTKILVHNVTLSGLDKFSSIIMSDQPDAVFDIKMHTTIQHLGFEDSTKINVTGRDTNRMLTISNGKDETTAYFGIRLQDLFFRGQERVKGPDGDNQSGIWMLDCIYLDLNVKGVWDLKIDDISCNYVHSGVTIDTYNEGWLTGSFFNNILVRGFSGWHTAIISKNNTARQVSQNVFSNLTAEVVYPTAINGIGFIVSGVGNDFNNLQLFKDGVYSGHAIQLRYFGADDPQYPSFGQGSSANNAFWGGTVEGDIDDPDNIRELQNFHNLRLQIKDDTGRVQQVNVNNPLHNNLLAENTIQKMLDKKSMISLPKTATATNGADKYGNYLEITTTTDTATWDIIFTEPDKVQSIMTTEDHSVGVRFRKMTESSDIIGGLVVIEGMPVLGVDLVGSYQNPCISGDLQEFSWVYRNNPDFIASLPKDSHTTDRVMFKVDVNSKVRLYNAYLSPGRVIDFSRITQNNLNNAQQNEGGRNYIQKGSVNWLQSSVPVTNQEVKSQAFKISINDLQWMAGKNIVISVDMSITSYNAANVTGRYGASLILDVKFDDGTVVATSTGPVNSSQTTIFGRYSLYLKLPNKKITSAQAIVTTLSGFTATSYRIGNPMLESGTVAHDYISYDSSRDEI
ncbi:hypothetical protein [Latilactobacillus phage TMW 1.1393 P1]|nr:hypothetical protein [Latilactobacillus phage TMW 1.1393 P1]